MECGVIHCERRFLSDTSQTAKQHLSCRYECGDIITGLASVGQSAVDLRRCLWQTQRQVGTGILHDPTGLKDEAGYQLMRIREKVGASHARRHATGVREVETQLS